MFKIYDGREYFYQWDLDRKLIVYDQTIEEVHFCNKTDDNSLVCDVYTEGDLHLVNVPNILLQDNWRINVYAFDKNYTKYSKQFDVKSRTKPANYIYTETEVKRWEILEERVSTLENSGAAGGGMFYVDMEYYTATAPQSTNRTFEEIKEAYNGGLNVICRLNNYHILPLSAVTEEQITFCTTSGADIVIATQGSDNSVFSEIIPMARAEDLEKKSNNVFYVEVTPVDEFNATCNKDFFDIQEAYNNGQEVKCIFEKFVLPVCFIIQNSQILFGGACAYQSLYVSVANLNPIEVTYALATLAAAEEVASKAEFNQLVTMYTEDITELTNRVDIIESLAPETAQVGQVAVVKEIDAHSRVTKWEAADLPSGGDKEWELYDTITVSEDISNLAIGNLTDATSLYAKGYKELYIVYSMNPHATTPMTELRIQINSTSGGTYASFPNYAPAAEQVVNGFLHIFIMPMARHSVILANKPGVYAAAGIIKTAPYDNRDTGLYDKISIVQVIGNVGAGSIFTIYGR